MQYAFEVVKLRRLWRMKAVHKSRPLPTARRTRTDSRKIIGNKKGDPRMIDPMEGLWI